MADFEKIIRKHANDEGTIPADSIQGLAQAIADYVGKNFVTLDRYNAKKTAADDLQEKLDAAEKYKADLDKVKADFDKYKADQTAKELRTAKSDAFKKVLAALSIPEKFHPAILRATNLDKLDFADGKFTDEPAVKKQAADDWNDFAVTVKETGVQSANPPVDNGGSTVMTRADVYKKDDKGRFVMDATQRQQALAAIIASEQRKG